MEVPSQLVFWLATGISLCSLIYAIFGNRSKAHTARMTAVESRIGLVENRTTLIESALEHVPDQKGMHKIEVTCSELSGKIEVLTERLKPVTAMASRIQDALIEKVTSQ